VVLPQLGKIAAKGPGRQPVAHFMATGATRDSDSELDEDVWLPFLWASMCVCGSTGSLEVSGAVTT